MTQHTLARVTSRPAPGIGPGPGRHLRRPSVGLQIGRAACRTVAVLLLTLIGLAIAGKAAGWESMVVLSASMGETAPTGSMVLGRPVPAREIAVGTIVLLPNGDRTPILHRVVERTGNGGVVVVRTRGDANPAPDPTATILRGDVTTQVLMVPRIGYFLSWVQTPAGWVTLILIPLLPALASLLLRRVTAKPGQHSV